MPTEKQCVDDYEELMEQYQADDEWDLPPALFIRWDDDDPDSKGTIIVIPTVDPKEFLQMLLEGGPDMALEVFRGIGEQPEDMNIASVALINEGWGISPEQADSATLKRVENGEVSIADLPNRVEVRLCLIVTKEKNVYFGEQERGDVFKWISRTDREGDPGAQGLLPYLLYPLVTGEPYDPAVDLREQFALDFRTRRGEG